MASGTGSALCGPHRHVCVRRPCALSLCHADSSKSAPSPVPLSLQACCWHRTALTCSLLPCPSVPSAPTHRQSLYTSRISSGIWMYRSRLTSCSINPAARQAKQTNHVLLQLTQRCVVDDPPPMTAAPCIQAAMRAPQPALTLREDWGEVIGCQWLQGLGVQWRWRRGRQVRYNVVPARQEVGEG